jgi:RNA polymerase sigma-70 factor (ECF subfamily)
MVARNAPIEAPTGDDVLVERCRRGDQRAFHALYERHYDYVARIVVRLLGGRDDLEDIMQETFRQAFESIHQLRSANKVRYWLTAIAARSAKRYLVARRKSSRTDRKWSAEVPEGETRPSDARLVEVYEALDRIPPRLRVPLLLHRVEGLTIDQVAFSCEVSTSTVKRRINAAEKRLKRLLHVD